MGSGGGGGLFRWGVQVGVYRWEMGDGGWGCSGGGGFRCQVGGGRGAKGQTLWGLKGSKEANVGGGGKNLFAI